MGSVGKFSEIDRVIKETHAVGCISDTSALIAFTYTPSEFSEDAEFVFKKLEKLKLPSYVNVTVRHEYVDFERRVQLGEHILSMPEKPKGNFLPNRLKALIGNMRRIVDERARNHELPVLSEREVKRLKKEATHYRIAKADLWTHLCSDSLGNRLESAWDSVLTKTRSQYVGLGAGVPTMMQRKPEWKDTYSIIEHSGLGGSDAMILNFLECSRLPFVLSCDFDLAYAALRGGVSKTVLIPDELYRRRMRPLL